MVRDGAVNCALALFFLRIKEKKVDGTPFLKCTVGRGVGDGLTW